MTNSLRNVSFAIIGGHTPPDAFISGTVIDMCLLQDLISRRIANNSIAGSLKRHTIRGYTGPLSYSPSFGLSIGVRRELAERRIGVWNVVALLIGVGVFSAIGIFN